MSSSDQGDEPRWQPQWQQPEQEQPQWQQPQPQWQQPQDQQWATQQPQWGYQQQTWNQPAPTSGAATASLILGICGFVLCPLSIICSPLALVFGYRSRREIRDSGGRVGGDGLALAGVILGWIGIAWVALWILWIALAIGGAVTS